MKRRKHAPRSSSTNPTLFRVANRVFHQKFGTGSVTAIDGNTSRVNFNKVGDKRRDSPWRADNSTLRHGRCVVVRQLPTQQEKSPSRQLAPGVSRLGIPGRPLRRRQLTLNQRVQGSRPCAPTIFIGHNKGLWPGRNVALRCPILCPHYVPAVEIGLSLRGRKCSPPPTQFAVRLFRGAREVKGHYRAN